VVAPELPFKGIVPGRKVRAPQVRTPGNTRREQSLERATENRPPAARGFLSSGAGKGEKVG